MSDVKTRITHNNFEYRGLKPELAFGFFGFGLRVSSNLPTHNRKAVAEREADRERKRERARRAKEAGPEAIRKDKYPRCTQ